MFFTPESVNPPPQISRDLIFLKSEHIKTNIIKYVLNFAPSFFFLLQKVNSSPYNLLHSFTKFSHVLRMFKGVEQMHNEMHGIFIKFFINLISECGKPSVTCRNNTQVQDEGKSS
ncbi:hypothetical protein PanWU01x14_214890 [Parasponia andersonii]|uniref:Uncharacterized protein n=1 Tax=Parasponia andersonii TaxID=3476 RepID=A0A2P5BS88_PARAD|nr:hypothetical protein PanWU01x14_214890 [Parasponia andersonii]